MPVDVRRIVERLSAGKHGAGGDDRMAQFFHHRQTDGIVGHPDSGGLSLGEHDLGNEPGPLQDKGVRTGEKAFHDLIGIIRDLAIEADVF